jgi:methyl-accepting chemotaxis protein
MTTIASTQFSESGLKAAWNQNAQDWTRLRDKVAMRGLSVGESFAGHTALVTQLLATMDLSADEFGLSLDPQMDSYKLIVATNFTLPALTEELGKARAKGSGMLATKTNSTADLTALNVYVVRADEMIARMLRDFDKASASNPELRKQLAGPIRDGSEMARQAVKLARDHILSTEQLSYSGPEYFGYFTKTIDALVMVNDRAMAHLAKMLDERVADDRRELAVMLAAMLVMIGVGAVVGTFAARSITRQLGGEPSDVVKVVDAIARGDLSSHVVVRAGAEHSIVGAMAQMQASLARTVGQVRSASDSIATGSAQIATGNQDLSQRTEEQASNLEQTAASMEQLNATVRNNADTARQATQLAGSASSVAAKGGEVVGQVVTTMNEITESSRRIADIIGVIDGIAFQTNILALNAAVEAARAGEQGRGFAVVASEVRSLAQRSAEAAKEIKSLIGASVDKVEVGSKLVGEAGQTMSDIVAQVKRVSDLISEISAATSEQTSGIGQINDAVTQLDQMTQQNAALVEESAAAAESLKTQAQQLVQAVAVFKLVQGEPSHVTQPIPAASAATPSAERRGPNRATNVVRPTFATAAARPAAGAVPAPHAKTGTEDWESF